MSTLSKKTKGQLVEIAEDLNIDIGDCKVKKDVYEVVKKFFLENSDKFDENSKYYELAALSKFPSPKKTHFVESENGDVIEDPELEHDDDETEEADDNEEEEEEEAEEEVEAELEVDLEEDEYDDDDDEDDIDFECYTNLTKAIQHGTVPEYLELKNYEIRDYLGDPYSLNEVSFYIETAVLLFSLSQFTSIDTYLPASSLTYVPELITKIPVLAIESFNLSNFATLSVWYLTAKILPLTISYYINFTYDFDRDAFTESLAKLFLAILVFKTDVAIPSIKDELKFAFSLGNITVESFKHYGFVATLNLRDIFGNWILIDALFTSILALYANLAFV